MSKEAPIVLLADDAELNLEVLATLMRHNNLRYECANTGTKAFAAASATRFDLLVLDIRMPGMLGYEVLAALREDPSTASHKTPAISVTGEDDLDGFFDFLRNQGFVQVIAKPWENDALVELILKLVWPRERLSPQSSLTSDPVQLLKLRRMFCDDLRKRLPQLERDYLGPPIQYGESVREAVHRLRGVVGMVGAPALAHAVDEFRHIQSLDALRTIRFEADAFIDAVNASN